MPYVYIASGHFGSLVLSHLSLLPDFVVTQADRLGGRGMKALIATPVKKKARELNLRVSEAHNKEELEKILIPYSKSVMLLSDFGMIIPDDILTIGKYGIWNIHPSLLPLYRGATPIQTALLNNEKETGVSIMKMDKLIDHGPVLAQEKVAIGANEATPTLMEKLAPVAAVLFTSCLHNPEQALENAQDQNHDRATYTKKLTKDDGYVQCTSISLFLQPIFKKYNLLHILPEAKGVQITHAELQKKIRALTPWPGVWSTLPNGKQLKFISPEVMQIEHKQYQYAMITEV